MLHYTGMDDFEKARDRLCARDENGVSCHYLITGAGEILQLVEESQRAWHAGVSFWRGETDVNSCSLGIELHHPGHPRIPEVDLCGHTLEPPPPPFANAQIKTLVDLCQELTARYGILPQHILGHSDVAPVRKRDPGEGFPWKKLWSHGVGLWVPPEPLGEDRAWELGEEGPHVLTFQRDLCAYGYGSDQTGVYTPLTAACTRAFQRHFRPKRVDGRSDHSTRRTLSRLLLALRT